MSYMQGGSICLHLVQSAFSHRSSRDLPELPVNFQEIWGQIQEIQVLRFGDHLTLWPRSGTPLSNKDIEAHDKNHAASLVLSVRILHDGLKLIPGRHVRLVSNFDTQVVHDPPSFR